VFVVAEELDLDVEVALVAGHLDRLGQVIVRLREELLAPPEEQILLLPAGGRAADAAAADDARGADDAAGAADAPVPPPAAGCGVSVGLPPQRPAAPPPHRRPSHRGGCDGSSAGQGMPIRLQRHALAPSLSDHRVQHPHLPTEWAGVSGHTCARNWRVGVDTPAICDLFGGFQRPCLQLQTVNASGRRVARPPGGVKQKLCPPHRHGANDWAGGTVRGVGSTMDSARPAGAIAVDRTPCSAATPPRHNTPPLHPPRGTRPRHSDQIAGGRAARGRDLRRPWSLP